MSYTTFFQFSKKNRHKIKLISKLQDYVVDPDSQYLNQLKSISRKFRNESNYYISNWISHGMENNEQRNHYKLIKRNEAKLNLCIKIEMKIIKEKISINEFFKTNKNISRSWYFDFKKRVKECIKFKSSIISNHLPKTPYQKAKKFKYPQFVRIVLCNTYYKDKQEAFINTQSFWAKIVHEVIDLLKQFDLSHMSLETLRKILNEDSRAKLKQNTRIEKDHPFRNKAIKPGWIQIDIKIFGRKETGLNKYVYVIDAIDRGTRILAGEVLTSGRLNIVIAAVKRMLDWFESIGIKVKYVQTDNGSVFKNNSFVDTNEFDKLLESFVAEHFYSPLGEPQCNGTIERVHKIYDDEAIKQFRKCKTLEELTICYKKFLKYYNHERYHNYHELKKLPKKDRCMIPMNAIQFLNNYNDFASSPKRL